MAYSQLILCRSGMAYGIIEDSKTTALPNGCARTAWTRLSEKYAPTTKQHKILVKKLFLTCRMKGDKSDPDEWFQRLDHLCRRLVAMGDNQDDDNMTAPR